jgi:hypothetical protein
MCGSLVVYVVRATRGLLAASAAAAHKHNTRWQLGDVTAA